MARPGRTTAYVVRRARFRFRIYLSLRRSHIWAFVDIRPRFFGGHLYLYFFLLTLFLLWTCATPLSRVIVRVVFVVIAASIVTSITLGWSVIALQRLPNEFLNPFFANDLHGAHDPPPTSDPFFLLLPPQLLALLFCAAQHHPLEVSLGHPRITLPTPCRCATPSREGGEECRLCGGRHKFLGRLIGGGDKGMGVITLGRRYDAGITQLCRTAN